MSKLNTVTRVCVSQHLRCGTTGVVTFLRGRTLYVAWLGDSQVILVRRGQVVELMKPHKPDREVNTLMHESLYHTLTYSLPTAESHSVRSINL